MKGFIILMLSLAGCGSPVAPLCQAPDVASTSAYVVNGTPSTDRRSTVYVLTEEGFCSGTVIGPHTVLTAGHCTGPEDVLVDGVGWFPVNQHITHPDYSFPSHDLQVIHSLAEFPPPYASIGLTSECSGLLVQGYGYGSDGALHEREVFESDRGYGIIRTGEGICNGDSGGPLYARTETGTTLVGVSSFGTSVPNECIGGTNGFVDLTDASNGDWVRGNVT